MSEPTSRRPAYAVSDRAVRILARCPRSQRNYGVNFRAGDGQKWLKRLMRRQHDYERVIARCHEHHYLDDERFVMRLRRVSRKARARIRQS